MFLPPRPTIRGRAPGGEPHRHPQEGGHGPRLQPRGWQGLAVRGQAHDCQEDIHR